MVETHTLEPEEWEFWDTHVRAQRLLTRELDRGLQRDCGISKAEFSVLVSLWRAPGREMRVGELSESLDWEKSRVSHQLTRMENRGFVERTRCGAGGRRTGIGLTAKGRRAVQSAILVHAGNIRRYFLDSLTPEQTAAIRAWSEQTIDHLDHVERVERVDHVERTEPGHDEATGETADDDVT
ncbi:MarR family winged helix-turn-helix transcriptional regulator [Streptomyces rugosispiralis]|uniref:MarR family winged helix-turn-helix transcriptional regulator n=1 Tax=Streptomyces rugosispiralis TaxID=2967341 RepID=A0ABT1UNT5_9ACTN|nr:MarR family winged helix-turn-helix transcriptional regulator [Streptomyces rugosispiralis]MCQ8186792.1 MarR family winged helix-turn-helix transcriptional regulator [Streptomyces rugosispiralis]